MFFFLIKEAFPCSPSCSFIFFLLVEASRQVMFTIKNLLFFTVYFQAYPALGVTDVAGIPKNSGAVSFIIIFRCVLCHT